METRGPEFGPHVQGPKASQWPAEDRTMVSQATQVSVISTAVAISKIFILLFGEVKKRQGA